MKWPLRDVRLHVAMADSSAYGHANWDGQVTTARVGDASRGEAASNGYINMTSTASKLIMEPRQVRLLYLYEFKLGHTAAEAVANINQAFGGGTANERTTRRWFAKFRSGDMGLQNEPRGHRPAALEATELTALVEADPRQTVREMAQTLHVHYATVSRHLAILGKVRKLDKWVPHALTDVNKAQRLEVCSALARRCLGARFLQRIVTVDEKWILYDNRTRSAQWLGVHDAPGSTPKPPLHPKKVMFTVWWSAAGVIHYSFLPRGQTINSARYCADMSLMHDKLCRRQPALVNRRGVLLLQDNARPHVAVATMQHINELGYECLPHPAYSPDISPTDYHFFRHLSHYLAKKCFDNDTSLIRAVEDFIASREPSFYERGITELPTRWQHCIDAAGDYFD